MLTLTLTQQEYDTVMEGRSKQATGLPYTLPSTTTTFEAVRYFRPVDNEGNVIGNRGITVVFNVRPHEGLYNVKYAICNGDTFNKLKGVQQSRFNEIPCTFLLSKEASLFHNLYADLNEAVNDGLLVGQHKRDAINMLNQMSASQSWKRVMGY